MAPARHPTLGQGRVERLGQEVGGEAAAGRGQQGRKRGVGEARLEVDERREQIHGGWVARCAIARRVTAYLPPDKGDVVLLMRGGL